jgi:hypothetical protein
MVAPMPVIWHERVCRWLVRSFDEICDASDWFPDTAAEIQLVDTVTVGEKLPVPAPFDLTLETSSLPLPE